MSPTERFIDDAVILALDGRISAFSCKGLRTDYQQ